jgi:hypothetical protein
VTKWQTGDNLTGGVTMVRVFDNQFVIVVRECEDGNVMIRYEDDRTNTLYLVCPDWLK